MAPTDTIPCLRQFGTRRELLKYLTTELLRLLTPDEQSVPIQLTITNLNDTTKQQRQTHLSNITPVIIALVEQAPPTAAIQYSLQAGHRYVEILLVGTLAQVTVSRQERVTTGEPS